MPFGLNGKESIFDYHIYQEGNNVFIEQREFTKEKPDGLFLMIKLSDWENLVEFINNEKLRNV